MTLTQRLREMRKHFTPVEGPVGLRITRAERAAVYAHLSRVIAKIKDPCHWTSHAFARDADGREVGWGSSMAVCWDIYGAWHATKDRRPPERRGIVARLTTHARGPHSLSLDTLLRAEIPDGYLVAQDLNDRGGHAETLAVLRRARRRNQNTYEVTITMLAMNEAAVVRRLAQALGSSVAEGAQIRER